MMKKLIVNLFPAAVNINQSFRIAINELGKRLAGPGFIFLSQVLMAQLMGVKGFGNFAVILCCLNLIVACCLIGFNQSAKEILPALANQQQWEKLKGFLRFSRRATLIFSLVFAFALFFLLIKYSGKYGITLTESLFWALLLLPFLVFIQYNRAMIRALGKYRPSIWLGNALVPASASIICIMYYVLNNQTLNTDAVLFIYLCCSIAAFIIISGAYKKILSRFPLEGVQEEHHRKSWLAASLPLFVSSLIPLLIKSSGVLFISYYFGNTQAGIYTAAVLLASIVQAVNTIPEKQMLTPYRTLFVNPVFSNWNKILNMSNTSMLYISLPVVMIITVFGKNILQFFGPAFGSSHLAFIILAIGHLVNFRIGFLTVIYREEKNKKKYLVLIALAFALDFVLNLFLVPSMGMPGAAVASVVTLTALNFSMFALVKKNKC